MRWFRIILAVCVFVVSPASPFSGDDWQTAFLQLREQAKTNEDLSGAKNVIFQAELLRGKKKVGTYRVQWVTDKRWSEEIALDQYRERRFGSDESYYAERLGKFPHELMDARQLIPFAMPYRVSDKAKPDRRRIRGIQVTCFWNQGNVCFDTHDGLVRSFWQAEVSDFSEFRGKKIPSTITAGQLTIKLLSIQEGPIDESVFSSAHAMGPFKGWFRPVHPGLLKQVPPRYPVQAKERRITGSARMWVLINEGGTVEAVRSLETADPLLQDASEQAVRQWTYSPAMCGAGPVEYEMVGTISYDLRP